MPDELRVEVRLAPLPELLAAAEAAGSQWMTDAERSRGSAMGSESRRHAFLAGHWLIRCLAAEVHGGEPSDWLLSAAPGGAPRIRSRLQVAGEDISVSLSHCRDWVAAAMAPFAVGLDVECDSKPRELLALADATFSPDERALLRGLPESERSAAFYLHWTVKEAIGKREGHGLRPELARQQQQTECPANEAEVTSWQFDGCSLALAGKRGMSVRVVGVPEAACRHYGRIQSVAS